MSETRARSLSLPHHHRSEKQDDIQKNSPSSPARARPTIPAPTMATSNVSSSSWSRCGEAREEEEEEKGRRRRQEELTTLLANRSSPLSSAFALALKKNAAARRHAAFLEAAAEAKAAATDDDDNDLPLAAASLQTAPAIIFFQVETRSGSGQWCALFFPFSENLFVSLLFTHWEPRSATATAAAA